MKLRHDRRLHPRVPVAHRAGVLQLVPRGGAPVRCRIDVSDVSVEGLRGLVDGSEVAEGTRVRLTVPGQRWFQRRLRVDGTIVRVGPDPSSCAIRFSPVRSRVEVGRYVERAGRAANIPAGRSPAYGWAVARALRLLAADLQRDSRASRMVVVTSPESGEGKSFIAASLALEMARSGIPVLLVDGDLHKPSLHVMFGTSGSPGVAQVFAAGPVEPVESCVHPTASGVSLMPAGASGFCPPLSSTGAAAFGARLRALGYPIVIVDTPPVLAAAETLALGAVSDDVIVTVRSGRTRDSDMRRALDLLARHAAPVRGVVLNDHNDPTRLPGADTDSALYLDLPAAEGSAATVAHVPVELVRG
jgi:protein-tyrosine kinase